MSGIVIERVLIITSESFPFGMAATNRIISMSKGFSANGLDTQVLSFFKYGKHGDGVLNPSGGIYEGIQYKNVFKTTTKNCHKLIRGLHEYLKPILVFYYCLKNLTKNTLVLYYSHEIWPAVSARLICRYKGVLFIKEETEHPFVRLDKKSGLYRSYYLKYFYNLFNGLLVITQKLEYLFRHELKYNKPVIVMPMIVDVDRFEYKPDFNNNCIVFSGELDDQKEGISLLIRSFSEVLKKHPDHFLHLFGKAPDDIQGIRFNKIISELQIEKNVIMNGYKIQNEMTGILMSAKMFVFSRPESLQATYGFSTKLGEYLATGKPVVTTRVGEIEKFLTDRKNAFICEYNITSITEKICEVIENYDFALKVGYAGRLCSLKFFNNKIETKKMIEEILVTFIDNKT